MVNFRKLTDRAKDAVEKRGGTDALKADAEELRNIAKGKGSLKEKARAATNAIKDPGTRGAETGPGADEHDADAARAVGAQRPQPAADSAAENPAAGTGK